MADKGPIPHSVLRSLVGASPEKVMQVLGKEGDIARPLPPGRKGYRLLSPGKMPGARGSKSVLPGCGFRNDLDDLRPPPELFILNTAAEQPPLTEVLQAWARNPAGHPGEYVNDIPKLAYAAQKLFRARERLIHVYLDDLRSDELKPLRKRRGLRELADPLNWWRDEDDLAVPAADHLIVLDITETGQYLLARTTYTPAPQSWEMHL